MTIDNTIRERTATHGDFDKVAMVAQPLKNHTRAVASPRVGFVHQEAIDMILHKIARIAVGNPNELDHWRDIEGYAKLVQKWLNGEPFSMPEKAPDQGEGPKPPWRPAHGMKVRVALLIDTSPSIPVHPMYVRHRRAGATGVIRSVDKPFLTSRQYCLIDQDGCAQMQAYLTEELIPVPDEKASQAICQNKKALLQMQDLEAGLRVPQEPL